jgi:hypothetical protein
LALPDMVPPIFGRLVLQTLLATAKERAFELTLQQLREALHSGCHWAESRPSKQMFRIRCDMTLGPGGLGRAQKHLRTDVGVGGLEFGAKWGHLPRKGQSKVTSNWPSANC